MWSIDGVADMGQDQSHMLRYEDCNNVHAGAKVEEHDIGSDPCGCKDKVQWEPYKGRRLYSKQALCRCMATCNDPRLEEHDEFGEGLPCTPQIGLRLQRLDRHWSGLS